MNSSYSSKALVGNWFEDKHVEQASETSEVINKDVLRDYDSSLLCTLGKGVVLPRIRRYPNLHKSKVLSNTENIFYEDYLEPIGKSKAWFKKNTLKAGKIKHDSKSLMESSYSKSYGDVYNGECQPSNLKKDQSKTYFKSLQYAGKSSMSKNESKEEAKYLNINNPEDLTILSLSKIRNSLISYPRRMQNSEKSHYSQQNIITT